MKKGFTLIELVIVIGILAILAAAVVLVLNPAQLLAQARDSQRLSDLGSIKSAIALYMATANSITLGVGPTCTVAGCMGVAAANGPFAELETLNTITKTTDATGWILTDLSGTSGGAALGALPMDPSGTATYFYAYKGDNGPKTFEIDGRLESDKYKGLMMSDGGNKNTCGTDYGTGATADTCFYEIGTKLDI